MISRSGPEWIGGVGEHRQVPGAGQQLTRQFHILDGKLRSEDGRAGDVPAGTGKAADNAVADRIADIGQDDGDRARSGLGGHRGWCLVGNDDVDAVLDKRVGKRGKAPDLAFRRPYGEGKVFSLDVAQVLQTLPETADERGWIRNPEHEHTDHRHACLGCLCGPSYCHAQQSQQELKTAHCSQCPGSSAFPEPPERADDTVPSASPTVSEERPPVRRYGTRPRIWTTSSEESGSAAWAA